MKKPQGSVLLFDRHKYTWLIIGLAVTAIGFLLMIGGKSDDPAVFSDAIFNFRRLTLAPILVIGGYAIQVYAIMKKSTNKTDDISGKRPEPHHRKQHVKPKDKK